ncbi:MAG: HlyD family efflux transporter periplasmic adaptor subunit [Phycisphaerales bacterium]|nr:HlyD family efflux transporter periplasmic adaptor subunit [Phycisphaerales bacterium]
MVVVILLFAGGAVGWLSWQQSRPRPFVVSGFVEADPVRVGSRVGGRIAEVWIEEGRRVQPAEKLFRIDPFDLRERLARAEAQLAAARAEHARLAAGFRPDEIEQGRARRDQAAAALDKLVAGPRPREIEIAREQLNVAKANLDLAQSEFDRIVGLREQAQAAQTEYDRAVRALKAAQAQIAATGQQLALLEEGTRSEDIAQARAALAEADSALRLVSEGFRKEEIDKAAAEVAAVQAEVAAAQQQLGELIVSSPCDCVVEAIQLRPGDLVAPNAPAVTLLDLGQMWVRAYVPESRLALVRLGQRVPIRVDGLDGTRFAAHVSYIARDAEFIPRNVQTPEERSKQVFRVKVTLDEGLDRLRVGMSADVLFDEADPP